MKLKRSLAIAVIFTMVMSMFVAVKPTYAATKPNITLNSLVKSGQDYTLSNATINGDLNMLTISISGGTIEVPTSTTQPTISDISNTTFTWLNTDATKAQTIIRSLKIIPSGDVKDININAAVNGNTTAISSGKEKALSYYNGHYYMYVDDAISWSQAYNDAKSFKFMGMQGYLATITSDDEYAVLQSIYDAAAWVGGTSLVLASGEKINDVNSITRTAGTLKHSKPENSSNSIYRKSDFYWATGPEAGQGMSSELTFSSSEPNGYGLDNFQGEFNDLHSNIFVDNTLLLGTNESCLRANNTAAAPFLNDIFEANYSQSSNNITNGYFVEFGGYTSDPGKPDFALSDADSLKVNVTGVSLNKNSLSFTESGKSEQLIATVLPTNASNKNVTWSTSDASIATVDKNGVVTAVKEGTVTITVTTEDGNFKATCTVTISFNNNTPSDPTQPVEPTTPAKPDTKKPSSPKTSVNTYDNTNVPLLGILLIMGMSVSAITLRKRKSNH